LNKRFLAIAITAIMLLGILVPLSNATVGFLAGSTVNPVTATPSSGPANTLVSLVPSSIAAGATRFTPNHAVFGMIDTWPSDGDEGDFLCYFVTTVAGAVLDERYIDVDVGGTYTAGEPIYRHNSVANIVTVGDTRLVGYSIGGTVYPSGSTVAAGDLDLARATVAFAPPIMHTGVTCTATTAGTAQAFVLGDRIYTDNDNAAGLWNGGMQVTSGDRRETYPSTTVRLIIDGVVRTYTYGPWTLVSAHVFDYQEGLYTASAASLAAGRLAAGDLRRLDLTVGSFSYPASTTTAMVAGEKDVGITTKAFINTGALLDEVYFDADGSTHYDLGEPIYQVNGATWAVAPGDARRTFVTETNPVTGAIVTYLPCTGTLAACGLAGGSSIVQAGDLDVGHVLSHFSTAAGTAEVFVDLNGNLQFEWYEWIYRTALPGVGPTAAGDFRISAITISDRYNLLPTTVPLPVTDKTEAQAFRAAAAGTAILATDPEFFTDFYSHIHAIPATWRHTGAGVWANTQGLYIDNDGNNVISVGDTRLTLVSTGLAGYTAAGYTLPYASQTIGPYYMPGTTVAALDLDLTAVPTVLTAFGAADPNAWSENILTDERYSSELLFAENAGTWGYFASDHTGLMGPFPLPASTDIPPPPAWTTHTAMQVRIPPDLRDGPGRHVMMLVTDEPPGLVVLAGWNTLGILNAGAALTYPAVAMKNPMFSVAWTPGLAGAYSWMPGAVAGTFGTTAGHAWFFVNSRLAYDSGWGRIFLHPGVADPYKPGYSQTLDTVWGTQGGNDQKREFIDHYLDYAILASSSDSLGDFQFDITVLLPHIHMIEIFVPPEFQWRGATITESIWTDITNDYQFIYTSTRSAYDPIAPGWTRVRIGASYGTGWGAGWMTIPAGNYHVRLFNLAAPTVAGLYHFKIYVDGISIGAGSFPITVVKAELNPAWILATVRTNLGLAPPFVSGRVLAEGSTPEGRAVSAIGYWGPGEFIVNNLVAGSVGAEYWVLIMGLAAGTYTLKAEASGYSPTTTDRLTVFAGQSYHPYITLNDSPDIHVTIFSKHGTGEIAWHNLWQLPYGTNNPAAPPSALGPRRDMMIELYDANNVMVGFWASNFFFAVAPKTIPISNRLMGLHDDGATIPGATQYNAWLRDNFDVLGNPRGNPSTVWDGHVPWDTADYVAGMANAQYSIEAFVTGYVMDESDSYQRTFTLSGTAYALQFDLRRSNWIETAMHMPANVFLSGPTTVTLTAEDAAGSERAAAAFIATTAMSANGILDGADVTGGAYAGGIVIEGWNAVFPNVGDRSAARDINKKDYGLNPTASTHSAGAVTLAGNPYTVKLYMADMGVPSAGVAGTGWWNIVGGDPQVSIFLCNSPQLLSFSIVNAWLWISMRSVDFEVPAHSRPWTFPGSEVYVEFLDTAGTIVDTLDPTIYGLEQDAGTTVAGFPIVGAPAGSFGVTPFDHDNINLPGHHEHLGVTYYGIDWIMGLAPIGFPIYRALIDMRSTRLPAGEYTFAPHTHGYALRRGFSVQVPAAGGADIEADLIQGGQIRVVINFKHEGVATGFNGFVRVEVLDAAGVLVGASIYGMAEPNVFTQIGTPGGGYLPYDTIWTATGGALSGDHKVVVGPAQGADFGLPSVTFPSTRNPLLAGVPPTVGNGQRATNSAYYYGVPGTTFAGWDDMNPSDANRLVMAPGQVTTFDVYGFYWYFGDLARTWGGGWPTTNGLNQPTWTGGQWDGGLRGSVDIPGWSGSGGGLYTVKVWAFDGRGPDNAYEAANPTDDWRMYSMGWELSNIEVPWGGAQELFITMNNMAKLRGTVSWIDMYGDLRPLAWAQVTATNPDTVAYSTGNGGIGAGASDPSGEYVMWLPAGTHDVSVSTSEAPQVWSASAPTQNSAYTVVVNDGWVGGGDTRLAHEEGVPVPELPSFVVPLSLFAALAASVWLLRKRSLNIPVMMK